MVIAETLIEDIILSHGTRGMDRIRGAVPAGYCARAARLILDNRGRVLIGTGLSRRRQLRDRRAHRRDCALPRPGSDWGMNRFSAARRRYRRCWPATSGPWKSRS
ncbi:MAG: hypothetical protein MZV70_49285 [Desulfobacterales bacterium]|nr:hypothetical protein [Desulfobacterales bacterium]